MRAASRRAHALLLLALVIAAALPAAAHQDDAAAPGPAGPGEVVARLPWGTDPQAVGGGPGSSSGDAAIEGVPASFLGDETGAVHILDTVNRRIVVMKPGAQVAVVPLSSLGESALLADFALKGKGWLVADRTANAVVEVGPDGAAGTRWTGFQRVARVGVTGERMLARDELALAVMRLASGGKVEEVSRSPHAVPVAFDAGALLARTVASRHAVFAGSESGPPLALGPHAAGDEVQGLEVIDTDTRGVLLLAISEGKGDARRGVWLTRVAAGGEVLAELLVPPVDERWASVPRFFRALPDGRVLSFRTTDTTYELVRFTLAPPAVPRRAAKAAGLAEALARARSSLCASDAPAARAAVEAAAVSLAFDETASRRLEQDLESLDRGTPPEALCALGQARDLLAAGDAAKARAAVLALDGPGVRDRRLHVEALAFEKDGEWREALRRWQRIVLDHADSPFFAEAQSSVLRIIDSGKLPGAAPK